MKGYYCPLTTPNEHKRSWLVGPTQLCLREVEKVDNKWICPKHGDIAKQEKK